MLAWCTTLRQTGEFIMKKVFKETIFKGNENFILKEIEYFYLTIVEFTKYGYLDVELKTN